MSKRGFWVMAIAATVAVPILALAIFAAMLDPNEYKQTIIDAVQHATGRALILKGSVEVSRSIWPTIEVRDVQLVNLSGGTRPDMARVERIEVQIFLPALLWRRLEVMKLTLIGPNILFEQVGDRPNWAFERPTGDAEPPSDFQLHIRSVHVQNGMITSRLPARTRVVGIRSLDLRHWTSGGPLTIEAVLVYADNQPFSLSATSQPTAGIDGPWDTQMQLAAFDTTVSVDGTITIGGNYDLQVNGHTAALEKLNALLPEMQLPNLHDMTAATHISNGPMLGAIPVIGATRLHIQSADFSDRIQGLKLGVTDISLPAAAGTATITGDGHYLGQPFALSGTFGMPTHLDGRADFPIALTAVATTGDAGFSGVGKLSVKGKVATDTISFTGLEAVANVQTPSLAAFRPMLGHAIPALTDMRLDGSVTLPADGKSMRFKNARLDAKEGDLSGSGVVSRQALTGQLRSGRLDLDAILQLPPFDLAAPAQGRVLSDAPLPWGVLRGPNLDMTVELGALTFAQQAWPKMEVALRLKEGVLDAGKITLPMPAGPAEVSLSANASGDAVPVKLMITTPAFPLATIAHWGGLPGSVTGTARIDARLSAVGNSPHELAASLDGSVSVSAIGGQLSNEAFVQMTAASLDALGIHVPPHGETTLRCLGLAGSFNKGLGTIRTIALETTYLQLDGVGQIDLGKETVKLKLEPLVQVAGAPVAVPVLVEGPFRGITGRLDATGLDKLGFALDGMFGGDRTRACVNAGLVPSVPPAATRGPEDPP